MAFATGSKAMGRPDWCSIDWSMLFERPARVRIPVVHFVEPLLRQCNGVQRDAFESATNGVVISWLIQEDRANVIADHFLELPVFLFASALVACPPRLL